MLWLQIKSVNNSNQPLTYLMSKIIIPNVQMETNLLYEFQNNVNCDYCYISTAKSI
jgi:hypothetical protein